MQFATASATTPGIDLGTANDFGSPAELVDRLGHRHPTLLAVWAHPDDESYLGAGLMAAVAARGGRVINVTATLGELGTQDPDRYPPALLAEIRRRELDEALAGLGVESSFSLGYSDGSCADVPTGLGARRVRELIDRVRPDAVLTFGPDGVTGHPDHRAVARWVDSAMEACDDVALLTTAAGQAWPGDLVEQMHRVNAFYPGYPQRHVRGQVFETRLDGDLLERKLAALVAHESQIGPLQAELGPEEYRRLAAAEGYTPANDLAMRLVAGSTTGFRAAA